MLGGLVLVVGVGSTWAADTWALLICMFVGRIVAEVHRLFVAGDTAVHGLVC